MNYTADETKLLELAAILRDRRRWPKGFKWDYYSCAKCALGLAAKLRWGNAYEVYSHSEDELHFLLCGGALPFNDWENIFFCAPVLLIPYGIPVENETTPEQVAFLIETAIEKKHASKIHVNTQLAHRRNDSKLAYT